MKREIKFRAWKNGFSWPMEVLSLEMEPEGSGRDGWALLLDHPCPRTAIIKKRFHKEKVKDLILMQFTGLHDKHSTEIYESDVVRALIKNQYSGELVECYRGVVEMLFGEWTFSTISLWRLCQSKRCEVIGNIYENPELLGGVS